MILHVIRKAEDFVPYLVECHLTQAPWAVVFHIFRWLMVMYIFGYIRDTFNSQIGHAVSWSMLQASLGTHVEVPLVPVKEMQHHVRLQHGGI